MEIKSKAALEPVSTIMTTELYKVTRENKLREVNKTFARHKIRHMPVVDGEKLVGIISLTDLQRLSFETSYNDDPSVDMSIADMLTVDQVMKQYPVTVSSNDSILKAAEILTSAEFHALPVVDGEQLVGIITTTDIIRHLVSKLS